MKQLGVLAIGVALLANGPVFAERLKFPKFEDAEETHVNECLDAKKNGVELVRETSTKLTTGQLLEERIFLSRDDKAATYGRAVTTRMYYLNAFMNDYGRWVIACYKAWPKVQN